MDNDKNILLVDCIFTLLWIESKAKLFFWKQLSKTLTYLTFLLTLLSKKHKITDLTVNLFYTERNNEWWRVTNTEGKHQNIRTLSWYMETKHVNKMFLVMMHSNIWACEGILIQAMTFHSLAPITCCHTIMQNTLNTVSQVLTVFHSQHCLKAPSLFWGSGNLLTISPCKIKMLMICSQHTVAHNIQYYPKKGEIGL